MKKSICFNIIIVLITLKNCAGYNNFDSNGDSKIEPLQYDNIIIKYKKMQNLCNNINSERVKQLKKYKSYIWKLENYIHDKELLSNAETKAKKELEEKIKDKTDLLNCCNQTLIDNTKRLNSSQINVQILEKQLKNNATALNEMEQKIELKTSTINELNEKITNVMDVITEMTILAETNNRSTAHNNIKLQELTSDLANSRDIIKQRDQEINELNSKINSDAEHIKLLNEMIKSYMNLSKVSSCMPFGQSTEIHIINVPGIDLPFHVRCNGQLAGPGWTVIQRRIDGNIDFYRTWDDYKNGFGSLDTEFFIGLEKLHKITAAERQELYIHFEDLMGETRYALYDNFSLGSEQESYALQSLGNYVGNISDQLQFNLGKKFSTFDQDNDEDNGTNCAQRLHGAWWYNSCGFVNLNGRYQNGDYDYDAPREGIFWDDDEWHNYQYSFKTVEMLIRPKT